MKLGVRGEQGLFLPGAALLGIPPRLPAASTCRGSGGRGEGGAGAAPAGAEAGPGGTRGCGRCSRPGRCWGGGRGVEGSEVEDWEDPLKGQRDSETRDPPREI